MSSNALELVVAGVWIATGIVVSIVMRRRGHAFFTWLCLGALLGPLALPLAVDAVFRERSLAATAVSPGPHAAGIAVLAGIDGSAESRVAARAAIGLLGDRLDRVTLAVVIDYDAAAGVPADRRTQAEADLALAADALSGAPSDRVILVGIPAQALAKAASEGDFDLLVVGSRGHGASRAILGSVASQLARGIGIPVLIGRAPLASSSDHAGSRDESNVP